jgi:hypothetical protein
VKYRKYLISRVLECWPVRPKCQVWEPSGIPMTPCTKSSVWSGLSSGPPALRGQKREVSEIRIREIRLSGCASSKGWRVQREMNPAKAKARSLVAWMAGRRETNDLKPIDNVIIRMTASHRAAAQANAEVAPKMRGPGGRAHNRRAKAAWSIVGWLTRCPTPAGWERQHGDKDARSNWRNPPPPVVKAAEQGRSYNRSTRESDRRGEGGGGVRKSDEAE